MKFCCFFVFINLIYSSLSACNYQDGDFDKETNPEKETCAQSPAHINLDNQQNPFIREALDVLKKQMKQPDGLTLSPEEQKSLDDLGLAPQDPNKRARETLEALSPTGSTDLRGFYVINPQEQNRLDDPGFVRQDVEDISYTRDTDGPERRGKSIDAKAGRLTMNW